MVVDKVLGPSAILETMQSAITAGPDSALAILQQGPEAGVSGVDREVAKLGEAPIAKMKQILVRRP